MKQFKRLLMLLALASGLSASAATVTNRGVRISDYPNIGTNYIPASWLFLLAQTAATNWNARADQIIGWLGYYFDATSPTNAPQPKYVASLSGNATNLSVWHGSVKIADFANSMFYDEGNNQSLSWNNHMLLDVNGAFSLDYGLRRFYLADGSTIADTYPTNAPGNGQVKTWMGGADGSAAWVVPTTVLGEAYILGLAGNGTNTHFWNSTFGTLVTDAGNGIGYAKTGNLSIDWNLHELHDISTNLALNWSSREFYAANGLTLVDNWPTNAPADGYVRSWAGTGTGGHAVWSNHVAQADSAASATTALGGWPTTWAGSAITSAVSQASHATNADNATTAAGGWPTTWAGTAITSPVAQATHATNADVATYISSAVLTNAVTNCPAYYQTWAGPTNSITVQVNNSGSNDFYYAASTNCVITNVLGSVAGQKVWCSLTISNSIGVPITNWWTAAGNAIGTGSTNALIVAAGKQGYYSIWTQGTGRTNYQNAADQ